MTVPRYKHEFRLLLFLAQGGCCMLCGQPMSSNRKKTGAPARDFATFEHIERRDEGGKMSASNIVLTHYKCNVKRNAEHQAKKKSGPKAALSCGSQQRPAGKRTPPSRAASDACVARDETLLQAAAT